MRIKKLSQNELFHEVELLINDSLDTANAAYVRAEAVVSLPELYLRADADTHWIEIQSTDTSQENSQCIAYRSGFEVTELSGDELQFTVPLDFKESFIGQKNVYVRVKSFDQYVDEYLYSEWYQVTTYDVMIPGSLQVAITPQAAIDAGAQWRRVGTTTWFNSGFTETGIPPGDYEVEFSTVTGWNKPANQPVTITDATLTTTSGTYTDSSLIVYVPNQSGMPDGEVIVEVWLSEGTGIGSFGFYLTFDPAILNYVSSWKGGMVPATGFTFYSSLINSTTLRVTCTATAGGSLNAGEGRIAGASFIVDSNAALDSVSPLTLSNLTGDIETASISNGTVTVTDCQINYDMNNDGSVTPGDALIVFKHYLGLEPITDECTLLKADANSDGTITPGDALIIFKDYLGLP
jgi:hypothetical protein